MYLNYGMHYLVNAVTEPEGSPAAVLIRALEPLEGERLMRRRRARGTGRRPDAFSTAELCRGPATSPGRWASRSRDNERDLTRGPLRIEDRSLPATRARVEPPHRDQRRRGSRVARVRRRERRGVRAHAPAGERPDRLAGAAPSRAPGVCAIGTLADSWRPLRSSPERDRAADRRSQTACA